MKVRSIFASVDGEINNYHQGRLSVFVRLAGCNLKCTYCDTKYAQDMNSGQDMDIQSIMHEILKFKIDKVTITGGEPLLQKEMVKELINELRKAKKMVSIETNGSLITSGYKANMVVDYKLPSSGMEHAMTVLAFSSLGMGDVIKFVIADKRDFERALQVQELFSNLRVIFAYSPVLTRGETNNCINLVNWMLQNPKPNMVLNVQLHKIINLNEPE